MFFAARAAIGDVRAGRPPYNLWAVLTNPRGNREWVRECLKDVGKVFLAAVVIDLIYEIVVFRWIYPGQVLIVAIVLAMLPYPLIRSLLNRIIRRWNHRGEQETKPAESGGGPHAEVKGQP
jgi:hypothetical protein